jgi:murein DD-endopeptidase MepM/ murein hydrolase activator NlpD
MKKILLVIVVLILAGAIIFYFYCTKVTNYTDTYIYNLPYKDGESYTVVQGYGGLFSHRNMAALDFDMPEGTPIHAAREGVVYAYKDKFNEGGPSTKYNGKANYIMIQHSDGSFGCYWHLKQYGVVVKTGKISKGQLIGYSGSTGFVLKPHLHFSVKRKLNYTKNAFVKTKFTTAEGNIFLETGKTYKHMGE